jgi:hypothetical protein
MGGEMIYILEQRLRSQEISKDKSLKVLQEVIKTMLSDRFIDEIFKPQEIFSYNSVRKIFDRLAHSSIMKLNTSSMNKLFDLMIMGLKHQILTCKFPNEILPITLIHIDTISEFDKECGSAIKQLLKAREMTIKKYNIFTQMEFMQLRHKLLTFVQNNKIKVSLFLQDSIQNSDGSLVIEIFGKGPPGILSPGLVKI